MQSASRNLQSIRGAIFDMDGVLVDNARYHIRAWQTLGKELGREFTPEAIRAVFGRRNREILPSLMGNHLPEVEVVKLTGRKEALYRDLIRAEIRPVPGLPEFLKNLKHEGIPAAVATSAPIENVEMTMEGLGLKKYWAAVAIGAEVAHSKPAPDIFLLAAKRLNLPPESCVVFEDSAAGLEAAHRAGCHCVAISTTHSPEELRLQPAFAIVPDFTKVAIADCTLQMRNIE